MRKMISPVRDGPLEKLRWVGEGGGGGAGGGGGGGRSTKKNARKGKLNEKNSCTPVNPKKIFML